VQQLPDGFKGGKMSRRLALALCSTIGLLLTFTLVSGAHAHLPGNYYPKRWKTDLSQKWWFTSGFTSNDAIRDRVGDGLIQWNRQAQPMSFNYSGVRSGYDPYVCGYAYGTNSVFWRTIDGSSGALGVTITCANSVEIRTSQLVFDKDEEWCTGTGNCYDGVFGTGVGANFDLWSIATHEWGHMTGFTGPFANGHFDPDAAICEGTDEAQQTMCPYYQAGSERWRTTNTHDEHTFQDAY
jgi:Matrixin